MGLLYLLLTYTRSIVRVCRRKKTQQPYPIETLQPPGHPVRAALLSDKIKGTPHLSLAKHV